MDYRSLDITIISADDIKNVNFFFKMSVYVVVSILDQHKSKKKTYVHKKCGTSPRWNHRLKFAICESSLSNSDVSLLFQLKCDCFLRSDKDIGEVSVPLHELLHGSGANESVEEVVDYQVRTPSGKPKGTFKFSYKFAEQFIQEVDGKKMGHEPMTTYPASIRPHEIGMTYAAHPGQGYGTPPPLGPFQDPAGYPPVGYGGYPIGGYGYPPPRYGYPPPPPPGYGYLPPPQQVQKPKKKRMGMGTGSGAGLGLGLASGLIGGMVIGEMASHAGEMEAYEEGYDDAMDMGEF